MDKKERGEVWSKDIETLIEDYEFSLEYPPGLPDAFCNHNYWMMAKVRDDIHELGFDGDQRVKVLDIRVLKELKKHGPPAYMERYKNKPLERWWHLDKIADKTYPPELLPEHLREIYLSSF
ncbi:MAG: hypothetical protein RMK35_02050 [Aquificaceae bacterium]|nr:hypothetical protein [Aquificaceae bacterium]MDW8433568.1 hypothetical protein [Aquificaceae bacterium]